MKIIKFKKKICNYFFLLLIIFIFTLHKVYNYNFLSFFKNKIFKKRTIIIEVDISQTKRGRGPGNFVKGIKDILPYNYNYCNFIPSKAMNPNNTKSDFFFFPYAAILKEPIYNNWINKNKGNRLILGPSFVPKKWNYFPNKKYWNEKRFPEILKTIKGIGVHSIRVRNYFIKRTNTLNMIKKYIIIRPCTNLIPKNLKPFINRTIDILFFEKYADLDRRKQAIHLLNLLKNSFKKIKRIKYGSYKKEEIKEIANDSKFIIYFSFYDTGAIGLKEIQNYGVFSFLHQKDLIIDNETSFFIPELAYKSNMKIAFFKIKKLIKKITKTHPNIQSISNKNIQINNCKNSLKDLCQSLI